MLPPALSVAIPATLDNMTREAGHNSLRTAALPTLWHRPVMHDVTQGMSYRKLE